jgi:hypothetical protein
VCFGAVGFWCFLSLVLLAGWSPELVALLSFLSLELVGHWSWLVSGVVWSLELVSACGVVLLVGLWCFGVLLVFVGCGVVVWCDGVVLWGCWSLELCFVMCVWSSFGGAVGLVFWCVLGGVLGVFLCCFAWVLACVLGVGCLCAGCLVGVLRVCCGVVALCGVMLGVWLLWCVCVVVWWWWRCVVLCWVFGCCGARVLWCGGGLELLVSNAFGRWFGLFG